MRFKKALDIHLEVTSTKGMYRVTTKNDLTGKIVPMANVIQTAMKSINIDNELNCLTMLDTFRTNPALAVTDDEKKCLAKYTPIDLEHEKIVFDTLTKDVGRLSSTMVVTFQDYLNCKD